MTKVGRRCYISGIVQGVFYRQNTKEQADARNLTGWVKNLNDGRVEVLIFGTEDEVLNMLEWLSVGPERATVTSVDIYVADYEPYTSFEIIRE